MCFTNRSSSRIQQAIKDRQAWTPTPTIQHISDKYKINKKKKRL